MLLSIRKDGLMHVSEIKTENGITSFGEFVPAWIEDGVTVYDHSKLPPEGVELMAALCDRLGNVECAVYCGKYVEGAPLLTRPLTGNATEDVDVICRTICGKYGIERKSLYAVNLMDTGSIMLADDIMMLSGTRFQGQAACTVPAEPAFKPILACLTEKGKQSVSHVAGFDGMDQVWVLSPVNEYGNVKIGTDMKGSVFTLIPACSVMMSL